MKKIMFILSAIALSFIFLYHLGLPALLDSDETRYADMARGMLMSKDFITPYLDGRIFWDKPPLFFWLLCLSYKCFGISEFSVRIPSVLCALSAIVGLYFVVKKTISTKVAIVSAMILATSVEFVIFAKVSILDMVLTSNITLSLLCGLMTYFVKEENKKYFWWLFYLFSAFGLLAKGIPAVVVPFGVMFFVGLWKKNLQEFFKPKYLGIGALIFLIVALPWHIMMYKIHGVEFIKEYIIKHHFKRFIGSTEIGRKHSFIYYIPTFIIGFLPWSLPFLFGLKRLVKDRKNEFVVMNLIGFVFTLLFFSSASTKLITYILPLYSMASVLCGYMWFNSRYIKEIKYSIITTNVIFITFALLVALAGLYLPQDIYLAIKPVQIPIVVAFFICGLFRRRITAFLAYVVLIMFLSGIMIPKLFNIWYGFGQDELMEFAKYAKQKELKLGTYNIWERFSLQYYYDGDVEYFQDGEAYGAKYVTTTEFKKSFNGDVVVVENDVLPELTLKYNVIKKGKRYSLVEESHE